MDWNKKYMKNRPKDSALLKINDEASRLGQCNMDNFDAMSSYQVVANAMKKAQEEANKENFRETLDNFNQMDLNDKMKNSTTS